MFGPSLKRGGFLFWLPGTAIGDGLSIFKEKKLLKLESKKG
jgi:hypothetical protein